MREVLCELQLPYRLISMAKEQVSDIGVNGLRLNVGEYEPVPNGRRAKLIEQAGKAQVPYLVDPNTDTRMYESDAIIAYLRRTYQS